MSYQHDFYNQIIRDIRQMSIPFQILLCLWFKAWSVLCVVQTTTVARVDSPPLPPLTSSSFDDLPPELIQRIWNGSSLNFRGKMRTTAKRFDSVHSPDLAVPLRVSELFARFTSSHPPLFGDGSSHNNPPVDNSRQKYRLEWEDPYLLYRVCLWNRGNITTAHFQSNPIHCLAQVDQEYTQRKEHNSSLPLLSYIKIQIFYDIATWGLSWNGFATDTPVLNEDLLAFFLAGADTWSVPQRRAVLSRVLATLDPNDYHTFTPVRQTLDHFCTITSLASTSSAQKLERESPLLGNNDCILAHGHLLYQSWLSPSTVRSLGIPSNDEYQFLAESEYASLNDELLCNQTTIEGAFAAIGKGADIHFDCSVYSPIQGSIMAWIMDIGLVGFLNPQQRYALIQRFVDVGADLNDRRLHLLTDHLRYAATHPEERQWVHSFHTDYVHSLLQFGAYPDLRDAHIDFPLGIVSQLGLVDEVDLLLRYGASVNARDRRHFTPLFRTASGRVAELLLRHGAINQLTDPIFRDTALHIAARNDRLVVVEVLTRPEFGFALDARNRFGETPLMLADDAKVVNLLLVRGANPNAIDGYGVSVLDRCIKSGNRIILPILLNAGAVHHL